MVHRNVHYFQPKQTYVINNHYTVQPQRTQHCCGGGGFSIWGNPMMLMSTIGMFTDFASGMIGMFGGRQQSPATGLAQEQGTNPNDTLKNLQSFYKNYTWIYQDGQFWGQDSKGNIIHGNNFDEIKNQIKPTKIDTDTDVDTETDIDTEPEIETEETEGQGGEEPQYGIGSENFGKEYTIKKGETWFSLAQTKYELPEGVSLQDVYTALAEANYDGNDFASAMKKGIVFMPGDKIKLPDTFEINGKKVNLKSDWSTSNASTNTDFSSKSTYRSAKVTQIGTQWFITQNGAAINTTRYSTEAEAKQALAALTNEDS